jgi:four helix bundle protein
MEEKEFNFKLEIINRRRNINRGYRRLIVWQDSLKLYELISRFLYKHRLLPERTSNGIIDAAHSVARNIAEGYGRKSKVEYLRFLDFAIGSIAEVHSSCCACFIANQITQPEFEEIDIIHYKVENALINLVIAVQNQLSSGWETSFANIKNKMAEQKNKLLTKPE